MSEEWRSIPGFEGVYEVSSLGRLRSLQYGGRLRAFPRIITGGRDYCGRCRVRLHHPDGTSTRTQIARLMLLSFVGPPSSPDLCACHNNGDAADDRLENLRWDTHAANTADALMHGDIATGMRHPNSRLTDDDVRCIRAEPPFWGVNKMLAEAFGVAHQTISDIRGAQRWAHLA